ncbi:MAG: hypothetical protein AAGH15_10085 [Myxococcota bacterium]
MGGLLLLHALATWGMVAVIWFVQLVHYPLFAQVGVEGFARYEALHTTRITWLVGPLMLVEIATAAALAFGPDAPRFASRAELGVGFALVIALWISTVALSIPEHARLAGGFDADAHRRLVQTNWLRTALWSARGALVTGWLWRSLGAGA